MVHGRLLSSTDRRNVKQKSEQAETDDYAGKVEETAGRKKL